MNLEAFRSGAAFYDVLFDPDGRSRREGPFLRDVLEKAPGRRIVDIACGTGFHAELFANLGAEVDAFDLSDAMVNQAKAVRPHPRVRYGTGDMRRVATGPRDLALCLGNSLSLLPDLAAVEQTFAAVRAVLARDGMFLVQVLNYARRVEERPTQQVSTKQVRGVEVTAIKNLVPRGKQTYLSLGFFAKKQGAIVSVGETAVLQHLDETQLRKVAQACGFHVEGVFGKMAEEPYVATKSSDLVMVFRRT